MTLPVDGTFLVHGFYINGFSPGRKDFSAQKRKNLTKIPNLLKRKKFTQGNFTFYITLGGLVTVLQEIKGIEIKEAYENEFDLYYERFLEFLEALEMPKDTEALFSFPVKISQDLNTFVSWNYIEINRRMAEEFIDAVSIYTFLEKIKNESNDLKDLEEDSTSFLENFKTLYEISSPEVLYTNSDEISFLQTFYREWKLYEIVKFQKENIPNLYTIYKDSLLERQQKSDTRVNFLLTIIAILGINENAESIESYLYISKAFVAYVSFTLVGSFIFLKGFSSFVNLYKLKAKRREGRKVSNAINTRIL